MQGAQRCGLEARLDKNSMRSSLKLFTGAIPFSWLIKRESHEKNSNEEVNGGKLLSQKSKGISLQSKRCTYDNAEISHLMQVVRKDYAAKAWL
jgi:hypothetical protein